MRFKVKYEYNTVPDGPTQFIRSHLIDVVVNSEEFEPVVVARMAIDHLDMGLAAENGWHLVHVCDAVSAEWEHVYSTVIEPSPDFAEIRKDFGFDDAVNHLLYIRRVVCHPALKDWQDYIFDHVGYLFDVHSAMVLPRDETLLSEKQLASLGFRKIAGSDLLFRPLMLANEYAASTDERDPTDIQAEYEWEDFVEESWDGEDY
jgi:hypothetical protein